MQRFAYLRPETLSDALAMLKRFGAKAKPLLGGTDLLVRVQKGMAAPEAVIDLKRVREIDDSVEIGDAETTIGARLVLSDLVRHDHLQRQYPALVEAASAVGSVQIRNRATLVGNLCNASPAADTAPPLVIYGGSVTIAGTGGLRRVPLNDFFRGPGKTACSPGELVIAVTVPIPPCPFGAAFSRLTRRRGADLAIINVACAIDAAGVATFAFGAVGPTVIAARDDSGTLSGRELPERRRKALLKSLIQKTSPISDVRSGEAYRRAMLLELSRRTWGRALQRYEAQAR